MADLVAPRPVTVAAGAAPSARARLLLAVAGLVAAGFVAAFVLPYASLDEARYGPFWPRRHFLLAHLVPGTVALLLAPVLLWLGLTRSRMAWHRRLGQVYLAAVAGSSAAAVGLAVTNPVSVVYGIGLIGLTVAWLATTAMAWYAVRHRDIAQHRDWMIRSAVVSFAFVWFRLVLGAGMALRIGTDAERFILAAWSCWAVPLLVTEVLLQVGRVRRLPTARRA